MSYGIAQEDPEDDYRPKTRQATKRRKPNPDFTAAGERIPPIHKPFKRSGCQWINGIGWVWNPTRRGFV